LRRSAELELDLARCAAVGVGEGAGDAEFGDLLTLGLLLCLLDLGLRELEDDVVDRVVSALRRRLAVELLRAELEIELRRAGLVT